MDRLDPHLLFEAARRFDRTSPRPEMFQDESTDAIIRSLRPGTTFGNTFHVGSGDQLERYRPAIVHDNRASLIRVEQTDHWLHNLPEVLRSLHKFLAEARHRPAMLWGHAVCWSERAVQAYANDLLVKDEEEYPEAEECPYGRQVVLRFEPHSRRKVTIQTDTLRWLRPDHCSEDSHEPLVKLARICRFLDGSGRVVGGSYREEVGGACRDWKDDRSIKAGSLPGLRGLIYGLALDPNGETELMKLPLAPGEKPLDSTGIIDVYLLKAMRLFERAMSPGREDVMADEVTYAFDRRGLVAYVAASCRRFEGWPAESRWGSHLLNWMGQNVRRGETR